MGKRLTRIVLGLAMIGILLPAVGCKPRNSGHSGGYYDGSYTDVFFGLDWLPGFGGYEVWDESTYQEYEYYDEYYEDYYYDEYYEDYYYDDYYDGYWDDGYWDDEWYDDDWRQKEPD
ncbi:MAG: hypothetical protein JXB62_01090 [Pirellulales bacterium]|nr:hypothetical protein [Pirellulales bacterium]